MFRPCPPSAKRPTAGASTALNTLFIACLLGATAPAAASSELSASSRSIGLATNVSDADVVVTIPGEVSTSSATFESGNGFATSGYSRAWGFMRRGAMEFDISAGMLTASTGAPALMFTDGQVMGYTIDSFVVTCPTCVAGTRGSLTLQLQADAHVNWSGAQLAGSSPGTFVGASTWASALSTQAEGIQDNQGQDVLNQLFTRTEEVFTNGSLTTTVVGAAPGLQSMSFEFIFGQPVHFVWNLSMGFSAESGQAQPHDATSWAALTMHIGHNDAFWNGITSVLDSAGQSVADYTAFSPDGVNFARAFAFVVPEPGTWTLMALGLAVLAAFTRRGRGRTAP